MFWNKKKSLFNTTRVAGKPLSVWASAVIPPLLWAGCIFFFSSRSELPAAAYSAFDFVLKKIAHITVFAVLFVLTNRGLSLTIDHYSLKKHWYVPVLICLMYALSDELHQHFVPNRHASIRDVGYDMLGVFTMYLYKTDRI